MDPLQFLVPLDWIEVVGPVLPFAILVMAVANLLTRHLAHSQHREQAAESDSVERYTPHAVTNIGLVLLSFLFILDSLVGGVIVTFLVLTTVIADVFEFEARNVEARNDLGIERPKGAIAASLLVFVSALYYSVSAVVPL